MRKFLFSVLAFGLLGALLAPPAALAQGVGESIDWTHIKGVYASTFQINLNDPNAIGIDHVPNSGPAAVFFRIGTDIGKGKKQCPAFSSTVSTTDIKAVAQGLLFNYGDTMSGVMQLTYDGAGSVVGEADFNFFSDRKYGETTDIQTFNAVNAGLTSRVCGGPNAATMDPNRCGPVCISNLGGTAILTSPPFNCNIPVQGTNSSSTNLGGGGYTTSLNVPTSTTTPPTPNDISSQNILHFYISALGLCGSAASLAQCCNDPDLDMIMHIGMTNNLGGIGSSLGTTNILSQSGVLTDNWGSGTVTSVFSEAGIIP